jgi:putative membrane protein insertion efficiency factor
VRSFSIKSATRNVRIVPIFLIDLYRRGISPFFGPACRFHPTCSAYARTAILRYGVLRGGLKALIRVSKCHPFHPGGYDPVD